MIKMMYFNNYTKMEELDKEVNKWLEENSKIKIIAVGQSEYCREGSRKITITIFYKEL